MTTQCGDTNIIYNFYFYGLLYDVDHIWKILQRQVGAGSIKSNPQKYKQVMN